ncbi:MAG: hypothetical protein ABJC24_10930 [Chloroflexota bacterium]
MHWAGWIFGGAIGLILASFVMVLVGARSTSRRGWVIGGIRLRYLTFGLLHLTLGLYLAIRGVAAWVDWGSLAVGLFVMSLGGAWLYGRGGVGPGYPLR